MRVLVIDVGGTHVKALASGRRNPIKIVSGPELTARRMATEIKAAIDGWQYEAVTIGYPGPVVRGRPIREPHNLAGGWVRFDYEKAFGCPVRVINDAAMQALGSYDGGRMLFLGLGTGLGSAIVEDNMVVPLELAHLPYKRGRTYEEYVGAAAIKEFGKKRWRRHVAAIVPLLQAAVAADYVVLGGGNAKLLDELPPATRLGSNRNAFVGGFRLWHLTRP